MIVAKGKIPYNKKMKKRSSSDEILRKVNILLDSKGLQLPPYAEIRIPLSLPEKEEFSSFQDIIYQILDKALLYKYRDTPIKGDKKLILFTWVIPFGLGDLSMQIHIADVISKEIPGLKIELISVIDEKSPLPDKLRSPLAHHIVKYSHPEPPKFTEAILKLMREAFSILEIPAAYYDFPSLKKLITKDNPTTPVISRIGQYGFIDTEDYHPGAKERSMGLYALEKGLIILDTAAPAKRDLNTYFAYLITENGILTYFLSILMHRKNDKEDLTIIVPNLGKIIPLLEEINFIAYGIQKIEINDEPSNSMLEIQKNGKTLTIEHKKNIDQKEFIHLMSCSNSFAGIRGDGSFTECLSTDALFFYDALDHAVPFLIDLYHVAHKELLPYFSLCEYLLTLYKTKEAPEIRAEKIAGLLDDPSLATGMEKLRAILREKYSFNKSLSHLVKKNYAIYHNPLLEEKEEQYFLKFLNNTITLAELLTPKGV
jgi:hypothetical protein